MWILTTYEYEIDHVRGLEVVDSKTFNIKEDLIEFLAGQVAARVHDMFGDNFSEKVVRVYSLKVADEILSLEKFSIAGGDEEIVTFYQLQTELLPIERGNVLKNLRKYNYVVIDEDWLTAAAEHENETNSIQSESEQEYCDGIADEYEKYLTQSNNMESKTN